MTSRVEYRVIYRDERGLIRVEEDFPVKDITWRDAIHGIRQDQVVAWERRVVTHSAWTRA